MISPRLGLVERVERLLHRKIVSWSRIQRGYTPAERWVATSAEAAVFVKCGVTPLIARWLPGQMMPNEPAVAGWICGFFAARQVCRKSPMHRWYDACSVSNCPRRFPG
ncbi:MAG TPA: hypothetical protein VHW71_04925 [Steroidobacteraceae bacterium]|jgi:hypothetical protein|nr:hypothetical protein [Steroidobacteraceae bacterium]